jgi:hypothetical protein
MPQPEVTDMNTCHALLFYSFFGFKVGYKDRHIFVFIWPVA